MGPIQFEFHFPEEVWEQILEEVTEDQDRVNCCLASSYLDWILTRGKPVWLFKKILPLVFNYLDIHKDFLSCRRVCSQWCTDVDHVIQTKRTCFQSFGAFPTWCELDSLVKLDLFLEHFSDHQSRNPFLDRTVYISAENPDADYRLKVIELFNRFGKHIWMLQISPEFIRQLGRFEWYSFLQRALKNTPHLRKLVIFDWRHQLNFSGIDNDLILNICGHYFNPTQRGTTVIPSLEINWSDSMAPDSAQSMLIRANSNKLQIHGVSLTTLEDMDAQRLPSNLFKLDLFHANIDNSLEGQRLNLTSHINKLKIGDTHAKLSIMTLLKILRNFPSITEVSINWSAVINGDDPLTFSHLENATVKSLTMIHREPSSYNFLRAFKALEKISVDWIGALDTYQWRTETEGDVQFYKLMEEAQIYESNMWKVIPSLVNFKIHVHQLEPLASTSSTCVSGNRDAYEEYHRS